MREFQNRSLRIQVPFEYEVGPLCITSETRETGLAVRVEGNWRIRRRRKVAGTGHFSMVIPYHDTLNDLEVEITGVTGTADYTARMEAAHNGLRQTLRELADYMIRMSSRQCAATQ